MPDTCDIHCGTGGVKIERYFGELGAWAEQRMAELGVQTEHLD